MISYCLVFQMLAGVVTVSAENLQTERYAQVNKITYLDVAIGNIRVDVDETGNVESQSE